MTENTETFFKSINESSIIRLDNNKLKNESIHYNEISYSENYITLASSSSEHVQPNDINDVKKFVYSICQEKLEGIWKLIKLEDIEIKIPK